MCTRYITPEQDAIERFWRITPRESWPRLQMFPRSLGPFIRHAVHVGKPQSECLVGQWGLIPRFAKTQKLTYSTVNARFEEITTKPSYREPWSRWQRCIVPAASFDEPCRETGKNVWWRFKCADGRPWGLAGLWNTWVDKGTGEIVESYTLLTINADSHPIMRRMHKPDPKHGPDDQDKRSVVSIEYENIDRWLYGSVEDASKLVQPPPPELINAGSNEH